MNKVIGNEDRTCIKLCDTYASIELGKHWWSFEIFWGWPDYFNEKDMERVSSRPWYRRLFYIRHFIVDEIPNGAHIALSRELHLFGLVTIIAWHYIKQLNPIRPRSVAEGDVILFAWRKYMREVREHYKKTGRWIHPERDKRNDFPAELDI